MTLDDLKRFEGSTDWMYRDTSLAGIPTVGYGFAIPDVHQLRHYRWSRDLQVVTADYIMLLGKPSGKVATYYKPFTRARLLDADGKALELLQKLVKLLERDWKYSLQPRPVQRALLDMAWNLGLGGLNKYKNLHAAVMSKNWLRAAAECSRRGVGVARNEWTRDLFLDLA